MRPRTAARQVRREDSPMRIPKPTDDDEAYLELTATLPPEAKKTKKKVT